MTEEQRQKKNAAQRKYCAENYDVLHDDEHKAAAKEATRRYRLKHPGCDDANAVVYNAKRRQWGADHPEELRERNAAAYEKYHEQILEEKRGYYLDNHQAIRISQAEYAAGHKDELSVKHVAWRKENPEKVRLHSNKRRALKYGNTSIADLLTEAQWRDILDQYHHRCAYCGKKLEHLTMDHVVPLARGGTHSANNVVPACQHCNSVKQARTPEQWVGMGVCNE